MVLLGAGMLHKLEVYTYIHVVIVCALDVGSRAFFWLHVYEEDIIVATVNCATCAVRWEADLSSPEYKASSSFRVCLSHGSCHHVFMTYIA